LDPVSHRFDAMKDSLVMVFVWEYLAESLAPLSIIVESAAPTENASQPVLIIANTIGLFFMGYLCDIASYEKFNSPRIYLPMISPDGENIKLWSLAGRLFQLMGGVSIIEI
ncbi:MAG: hypothetical protein OEZ55_13060, partial [Nitrospinota bacterium]|nr:hypothetical protein [Nitrospinota bacterium]